MNKGKIVSQAIKESDLKEGFIVYWTGCPSGVKIWYVKDFNNGVYINLLPSLLSPRMQTAHMDELKELVIEYDTKVTGSRYRAHLKYDDWKIAIQNNLVDSGDTVEFSNYPVWPGNGYKNDRPGYYEQAQLIIRETWDDIYVEYMKTTLSTRPLLKEWLEKNYNVPTKRYKHAKANRN